MGSISSVKKSDLAIVGASFAGLSCAKKAAKAGLKTVVIDRKQAIGTPIHTTGLLVKEAAVAHPVPAHLTRVIRGVRLYAPSLRFVDLYAPDYYFLATDTTNLLRWFANKAVEAGANLFTNTEFRGGVFTNEQIYLPDFGHKTTFLVGADGPRSTVARHFGLGRNTSFLVGAEAEYRGIRGLDQNFLHCFLDFEFAPGYLGWIVPGFDGIQQVGLACKQGHRPNLKKFIAHLARHFDFKNAKVFGYRAGFIPTSGPIERFASGNVFLIGDAAGLVSPLTGGGIHTALDSGSNAAVAIRDFLENSGPHPAKALEKFYPTFFWKRLLRSLFDLKIPNTWIDACFSSLAFRAFARTIFFHHDGLLSAKTWLDLLKFFKQEIRSK